MVSLSIPIPQSADIVFWIAVEAMPSELVRQFTLLREVDAKYSGT